MAYETKIVPIGNSFGVILPKTTLDHFHLQKGDPVRVSEGPEGIVLNPYDAEFAAKMEVASDIMRRYRNAFKKLAE
jgi:putative addiction module antidote